MSSANIQDWQRTRTRILETIPDARNRATLLRYLEEREANGKKDGTLSNEGNAIRDLCLHLGDKPLEDVVRADITAFVNAKTRNRIWRAVSKDGSERITRKEVPLMASTLSTRKQTVKWFFRWLRGTEEYPPEVRHLKTARPKDEAIPVDELVTARDLAALIQTSPDRRDKALLAVLYESGFRNGELCSLNIGSVEFLPKMARVTLPKPHGTKVGPSLKTGPRSILLWDSVGLLRDWIENHPLREDPHKPLFYSNSRRAPMRRMTNGALGGFVKNAAARAGLKKHLYPHLFRHSAATERANLGWNEGQMRQFFGWARNSDMPSRYIHLAQRSYEKMELQRRGLVSEGDSIRPALSGLICAGCGTSNLVSAGFCIACERPVSPAAVQELQRRQHHSIRDAVANLLANERRNLIAAEVKKALDSRSEPMMVKT